MGMTSEEYTHTYSVHMRKLLPQHHQCLLTFLFAAEYHSAAYRNVDKESGSSCGSTQCVERAQEQRRSHDGEFEH